MQQALSNYADLVVLFWPSIACGLATAVAGAVLGVFVLLRREALLALALPQVVAAGAALGLRFLSAVAIPPALEPLATHVGWPTLPPAIVAVAIALIALARARLARRQELLLPCLYVGGLCASFLLIAGSGQHLIELQNLFTGIDVATDPHVAEFTVPLLLLIAIVCALLWRRWMLMAQMPAVASLSRLHPHRWDALFLVLLCGAVLLATNALGVVLMLAMLFLPAATVLPFTRRVPPAVAMAIAVALATYAIGFVISNEADWPQSQSVGGTGFAILVLAHLGSAIARFLRRPGPRVS